MKKILFGAALALSVIACKTENKETTPLKDVEHTETVATTTANTEVAANLQESTVWYKGSKVIGNDSHEGYIPLQKGFFLLDENNKLSGGEFVIDMNGMTNTDIKDPKKNENLLGHLKNEDFFEVENYPTSKFKITSVEHLEENGEHKITGLLTIKNTTKEITIPAVVKVDGKHVSLDSEFTFDRTKFGIEYSSSLTNKAKDKLIKDEIEMKVSLES